jgi:hypothetical protein
MRVSGPNRLTKSPLIARIDARELADRLYMSKLSSVYHGEAGVRTLKELGRSYLTISKLPFVQNLIFRCPQLFYRGLSGAPHSVRSATTAYTRIVLTALGSC